jgi:hypothetical protein
MGFEDDIARNGEHPQSPVVRKGGSQWASYEETALASALTPALVQAVQAGAAAAHPAMSG